MKKLSLVGGLAWGFLMCAGTCGARDYYVAPGGSHGEADSWESAFTNLQDALTVASSGDVIRIRGAYTNSISDPLIWTQSDVVIFGGYEGSGSPGSRDPRLWPTVIQQAGNGGRLLWIANVQRGGWDGVIFQGGYVTNQPGGGLWITNSSLFLRTAPLSPTVRLLPASVRWYREERSIR